MIEETGVRGRCAPSCPRDGATGKVPGAPEIRAALRAASPKVAAGSAMPDDRPRCGPAAGAGQSTRCTLPCPVFRCPAQHRVLIPEHQQLRVLLPVPANHQDIHAEDTSPAPPRSSRCSAASRRGRPVRPSPSPPASGHIVLPNIPFASPAFQAFRAAPQNSSTSAGVPGSWAGAGRQREQETTPGGSRSSPSKKRPICSGVRKVIDGVPTWFQCRTASSPARRRALDRTHCVP